MSDQSVSSDLAAVGDAVTEMVNKANAIDKTMAARAKAKAGTGHAKFQKLAVVRTKAAIRAMRLLAKMGRSKVFEYSSDEAQKIVTALSTELIAVEKALAEPQHQTDIEFDLN